MNSRSRFWLFLVAVSLLGVVAAVAQTSPADYEHALDRQQKLRGLATHVPDQVAWIDAAARLIYRRSTPGGHEFVLVDVDKQTREPAFDHAKLAGALGRAMTSTIKPEELPFEHVQLNAKDANIEFDLGPEHWRCETANYVCAKVPLPPAPPLDPEDQGYDSTPKAVNGPEHGQSSPDGKWLAYVENYNVVVRPAKTAVKDVSAEVIVLSHDGSEGDYYSVDTLVWSSDSRHLAAYRIQPGYRRLVHYIESSPSDQLQPKLSAMVYPKAGDVLSIYRPALFDIEPARQVAIDTSLFPNPYEMTPIVWWKDGRGFTFEYNERGHQRYRVIEVDAASGRARALIEEKSATFINYEPLTRDQHDHGKRFRQDLGDGRQIVWASERDGWEHLYLLDGRGTTAPKQITAGEWVVRAVDRVDEAAGQIWFEASGKNAGEDPYYVHGYRIGLDGSGLTELTPERADHMLSYSSDGKYFTDIYSRLDQPPVLVVRRADGAVEMEVDKAGDAALKAAGWHAPEPFHTTGRDGKTEIWGVIYRPEPFDPSKKYPVVEDIYAGPQGSFVPKSFTSRVEPLTGLGFVVVQIDGMGTNNRSRAFHDVAWRNLKDAGFPDRILWHKAVAARYPWYDISRVGVFGTSAGGQSAMAALLFHPEFYKAAVSNSGCHDNRMDKIWWNEQWMGWPVGPWYAENSNMENAFRLQGKLMLVVGEMDHNVDPASTLQVADRLIKANKDFELLFVPGGEHGAGGRWGQRKLMDFFVRNLLGQSTPDWNNPAGKSASK